MFILFHIQFIQLSLLTSIIWHAKDFNPNLLQRKLCKINLSIPDFRDYVLESKQINLRKGFGKLKTTKSD